MKYTVLTILSLIVILCRPPAAAVDTMKVLMLASPYDNLPSEEAVSIDSLNGKVFINGRFYSGRLRIMKDSNGLYVINHLPFERYVEGVVASELGKDWELEALKAQAVISRTYAIFYRNLNAGKDFHLTSSVLHQLYKGANTDPLIAYAVKATEGEILTYNGLPIKAFFHATCVGKTEIPEEVWSESLPYLKSVDCNTKNAPYSAWQRRFSLAEIARRLGISGLKDIKISSYTATGRVRTLRLIRKGPGPSREIRATELRKLLGFSELPSTRFSLSVRGGNMIFTGSGYGHGVGLSQWGAFAMAREGKDYREILMHYYPGTTLTNNRRMYSRAAPTD
ncbi:MAG: SpoIID/LytB domain-containing protein [Deferribacteres bacterium]|nr:SpoIID/LytB domain-containing protein [Deferribacteres bacterium]